jgi:hypothetical protein
MDGPKDMRHCYLAPAPFELAAKIKTEFRRNARE